jgi:hypothetical protein
MQSRDRSSPIFENVRESPDGDSGGTVEPNTHNIALHTDDFLVSYLREVALLVIHATTSCVDMYQVVRQEST